MPRPYGILAKKILPIIFAIDTSENMDGDRIATINEVMSECVDILQGKSAESPDADIKIGVLKFSSGVQWITKNGLVSPENFFWNDVQAGGAADLGAAINEIESKLSRSAFLVSDTGFLFPLIIFISGGVPTDDWQKALKNANVNNKFFKRARKIAVAIGDDADKDVLKELVGNIEAVVQAYNMQRLMKLIFEICISTS